MQKSIKFTVTGQKKVFFGQKFTSKFKFTYTLHFDKVVDIVIIDFLKLNAFLSTQVAIHG